MYNFFIIGKEIMACEAQNRHFESTKMIGETNTPESLIYDIDTTLYGERTIEPF